MEQIPDRCGRKSFLGSLKRNSFVHVLIFISFIVSGLFINFCQLLVYVTVRPFCLAAARRVNKYLNYAIFSQVAFLMEWWSNTRMYVDATPEVHESLGKRNELFLMNHTYEIDAPATWMFADHYNVLGRVKCFVKKELLFVPVIGWSWFFAEFLFLERDWARDKSVMEDRIASLNSWPEPFWMLLFPEGTRFTPEKHAAAVEFARSKGLPVLNHLLMPRAKGFQFLRKHFEDCMKDVYDILMVFDKSHRNNIGSIYNGVPATCRVYLRHFKMSDIPEDDEGCKAWLIDRYVEKDDMLDYFKRTGKLMSDEARRSEGIVTTECKPTWTCLANTTFWFGAVHSYVAWWLLRSVMSGNFWIPGIYVAVLVFASYGLKRMLSLTSVKDTASNYGKKTVTSTHETGSINNNVDASSASSPSAATVARN